MTRTEIKREAKEMVAWKGPHNVLEFGDEIAGEMMIPKEYREEIVQEAVNQANRVLDFLGI